MRRTTLLLLSAILILVILIGVFAVVIVQQLQNRNSPGTGTGATSTATSTTFSVAGLPHTQGTQIVDANGHSLLLRGAQIETSLNYKNRWDSGERPSNTLPPAVFTAMAQTWHMNTLRLPLSNWLYAADPTTYLAQVDTVVQRANSAGLYVVLDLHDDKQAGSPYSSKSADLPKNEDMPFWKAISAHYKSNKMVMFDVYNEPKDPSWQIWLHGGGKIGGATVVGFQDLVNAIRSVGAYQIIVVEPGSSGKTKGQSASGVDVAEEGGWSTVGSNTINDPNVIYSLHVYEGITATAQQEDAKWGPILGHYPLYYGEWAFLPNAGIAAHCQNLPTAPAQSSQVVQSFLNYMQARGASWTAWQFAPHFLVQDYSSFQPTTLNIAWTCGNTSLPNVGMGEVVKQFLQSHPS